MLLKKNILFLHINYYQISPSSSIFSTLVKCSGLMKIDEQRSFFIFACLFPFFPKFQRTIVFDRSVGSFIFFDLRDFLDCFTDGDELREAMNFIWKHFKY